MAPVRALPTAGLWLGILLTPTSDLVAAPADNEEPPPLTVRLAYSPKIRRLPAWSSGLDCTIARVGGILGKAVGRDLTVHSRIPWFGADVGRSPRELRAALVAEVERGGADLVLGIAIHVRPPPPATRPEGVLTPPDLDFTKDEGLASYTHGYVVVDVRGERICDSYRLVAHEIGHVFGGVHRQGHRLLMDPQGLGVGIDPLNAELFSLHRDRSFGIGKAPLAGDDLRTLWRLAGSDLEDPWTWLVVGILAAKMDRTTAAAANYQRAIALEPDYAPAHAHLGHARFQLGELEAAIASYLKALEIGGDDGRVANNLAAAYYGLGSPELALPYVEKALASGFAVHPGLIAEIENVTRQRADPD